MPNPNKNPYLVTAKSLQLLVSYVRHLVALPRDKTNSHAVDYSDTNAGTLALSDSQVSQDLTSGDGHKKNRQIRFPNNPRKRKKT
jgi:hypothetical protein